MLKRILISILLIVSLLLLSCFPKRIPLEERTPPKVLAKLIGQEKKLHSMAVLLSLRAKDQRESISSNMELYWSKPDSFAFYFQSILGTNTARGKLIGDSLEFYFADENRYFKGECDNLESDRFVRKYIRELLNLAVGIYGFENKRLVSSNPQGNRIVYELADEEGIWRWWVNSKKIRVERGIFSLKDSQLSYNIKLKGYFESKGFWFPRQIEIISSSEDEFVKLKLIERKVNYPIPAKKFDLKIPKSVVEADSF